MPASAAELALSFSPVVEQAAPAVVNIAAARSTDQPLIRPLIDDPFFRQFFERFGPSLPSRKRVENSLGSGVIIDAGGLIVTNHHVVEGADRVTVVLADRTEYEARILRTAEEFDVALLAIDPDGRLLPYLPFGDSDVVDVGDLVLAIGNPFGIGQSVSSGIISATARSTSQAGVPFLQTDAAINPGNSGGALVTLDGRLVGINSAIVTRGGGSIGIGFAIPATFVEAFVAGRFDAEPSERPWLGADLQAVDAELADGLGLWPPRGALVEAVYPESPADLAGVERGDVLLEVDGVEVLDAGGIDLRLALYPVGDEVAVRLWRDGREGTSRLFNAIPPRYPPADPVVWDGDRPLPGLRLANMSPALAIDLALNPFIEGVVVMDVYRGSLAEVRGFRPGDVIVEVGEVRVRTHEDLAAGLRQVQERVRLVLQRGANRLQVYLQ